jgi:hypothetical protein
MKDGFGFDVGTSPHGLSVDRQIQDSETLDALSGHSHAKPLLTSKGKRLPNQSSINPPPSAKPVNPGEPLGFGRSVVPVSAVAREWGISSRRVRVMLAEGRLAGRMLENGFWEVFYPYQYVFGTRGPAMKRQQKQERRTA